MSGRFYDRQAWRKTRKHKLALYPVCEECNRQPATEVHDLQWKLGGDHSLDLGDLQSLCKACHTAVHRHFRTVPKLRRPKEPNHGQD